MAKAVWTKERRKAHSLVVKRMWARRRADQALERETNQAVRPRSTVLMKRPRRSLVRGSINVDGRKLLAIAAKLIRSLPDERLVELVGKGL